MKWINSPVLIAIVLFNSLLGCEPIAHASGHPASSLRCARLLRNLPYIAPLAIAGFSAPALSTETCTYSGSGSYSSNAQVQTDIDRQPTHVSIRARLILEARTWFGTSLTYLDELTLYDKDGLKVIQSNRRTIHNSEPTRQIWDVFRRTSQGLEGYRIQGKSQAEFANRFPNFASQWSLARFGQDWVRDFDRSKPERRADLDLKDVSPSIKTPVSAGFYWVRFLPPQTKQIEFFDPGQERERKRFDLAVNNVTPPEGVVWQSTFSLFGLSTNQPVGFLISPTNHLTRAEFHLHYRFPPANMDGELRLLTCR